jgi:hypothetical protein
MTSELTKLCKYELDMGLTQFGEHMFFDKGPAEVTNLDYLVTKFLIAGVPASLETFTELLKIEKYGRRLASAILLELQEWDELWDSNEEFLGSFL